MGSGEGRFVGDNAGKMDGYGKYRGVGCGDGWREGGNVVGER